MITHEMSVVKELCDRVAVMDHGKVIEQGDTFSVFASPKEGLTKTFISTTSNLKKIYELMEDSPQTVETIRRGDRQAILHRAKRVRAVDLDDFSKIRHRPECDLR